MTEPERPAGAPSGGSPTPEEISARLEALLKRTHALRAERSASPPSPPLSITWPPPDRELDHYDVVDVPDDDRMQAQPPPPPAPPPARQPETFSAPDWSELRLRTPAEDAPVRSPWLGVVAGLLALVALGEAAYIWHLHTTRPAVEQGRLRVDGPDGAQVRVDGRPVGPAPIEHTLAPGEYVVEVGPTRVGTQPQRVTIDLGRTVVVVPVGALPPDATPASGPPSPAAAPAGGPSATGEDTRPATTPEPIAIPEPAAASAAGTALVTDTTGAVAIESTTPGLAVTMGGRPRGVTPITLGQIKPGRHDVLVGGLARQVDVQAGKVTTLRVAR